MADRRGGAGVPGRLRARRFGARRRWSGLQLRAKGVVLVAIPLAGFAAAVALSLLVLTYDGGAQAQVRQTERVQRQIAAVDEFIGMRQADQRGYLALGDATDQSVLPADEAKLTQALTELAALVGDSPSQSARLQAARVALDAEPPLPAPLTRASSQQGRAEVAAWMTHERTATNSVRQDLASMTDTERALLDQRRSHAARVRLLAGIGIAGLLIIGIVGAFFGVRLFTRSISRRVGRLEADLGEAEFAIEHPPDDSADVLGRLARRLHDTVQTLGGRESELRDARTFLESILTVGPVVVIRTDGGSVTYVSPNCERVLGISEEEVRAPRFLADQIGPDELARFEAATSRLFGPDAPEVVEFESVIELGGRRRHFSCLVTREAETADDRGFFVYVLDITARRTAEHEGAQRQRELSAITAASPDVIAVFTADLQIAFVSEATTSITGYRASDRIGENVGAFVHEEDAQTLVNAVRSVVTGAAEDFTVRVRTRHVSGRYVPLEAHGRPLLGSSGEPTAAVAIFRDISERVALEEALVEARDVADAASRAKSEFLSRMSHELRTPLNVVLGFAQLLNMESLGDEQSSWIDQILIAGRHLLDLINEVLDIARIESGALALSSEPVSLRDVVGETVESMRPIAASNEISMDFLIEGDDLYVQADRQRLKQVLLNLLGNSVKYNRPHGSVLVTCKVQDERMTGIRVSDTGMGIAAENIERLFVPFDRLGAENSNVEGTGVGLPLSLRLVEAMHGDLSVDSTPGEGSTFTVALPRASAQSDAAQEAAIADAERQMTYDIDHSPRGTLLYIEDNVTNVHLMQRVIARRPGLRLLHAAYGRIGLDLARTARADLILLDLHLPDMTGMDVLSQLRADRSTADVPVYIVSADATAGQAARLRAAGADGYLTKPLDVRRFLSLLDVVFQKKVAATEENDDARSIS